MFIQVESEFLLFPAFDIETPGKSNRVDGASEAGLGRFKILRDEVAKKPHGSTIIVYLFFPAECDEGLSILLDYLCLPLLLLEAGLVVDVEIHPDEVLEVVQDGCEGVGEVHFWTVDLLVDESLEDVHAAHEVIISDFINL